jgi:hypothetical protein
MNLHETIAQLEQQAAKYTEAATALRALLPAGENGAQDQAEQALTVAPDDTSQMTPRPATPQPAQGKGAAPNQAAPKQAGRVQAEKQPVTRSRAHARSGCSPMRLAPA